jgi:hypothetical protein
VSAGEIVGRAGQNKQDSFDQDYDAERPLQDGQTEFGFHASWAPY